jgi:MerR family transcriptional regulator/heat shock protein HspR
MLREVQRLSQEEGVNLAGIKRIMELELEVGRLQQQADELLAELDRLRDRIRSGARVFAADPAGDIVVVPPGHRGRPTPPSTALVVWRSGR